MNILGERIYNGQSKEGRHLNKHSHFAKIYTELLSPYIGSDITIVELGINHGGSLQLWKEYLGSNANIIGLDVAENTLYEEPQIKCFLIDQSKADDIKRIKNVSPRIDVFIDDGSHYSQDQIATFEEVFPYLSHGGIYVVEDTHTSYRQLYGMGYKHRGSFIEYAKNIIDSFYKNESEEITPNPHFNMIESITFHFAMVVIKKL